MGLILEQCNLLGKKDFHISVRLTVSHTCTLCAKARTRSTRSRAWERWLCRGNPREGTANVLPRAVGGVSVTCFSPSTRELLWGPGTGMGSWGRAGRSGQERAGVGRQAPVGAILLPVPSGWGRRGDGGAGWRGLPQGLVAVTVGLSAVL